jgi:hypothetical protein
LDRLAERWVLSGLGTWNLSLVALVFTGVLIAGGKAEKWLQGPHT